MTRHVSVRLGQASFLVGPDDPAGTPALLRASALDLALVDVPLKFQNAMIWGPGTPRATSVAWRSPRGPGILWFYLD